MTRVLHIISDTNIGGGGRALLNYLQFADREKFELAVVLPEGSALKPRVENLKIPLSEIPALAELTLRWPIDVRFIELMPMTEGFPPEAFLPCAAVLERLPELERVPEKGGTARLYRLPGALGNVGLISPVSDHFCASCDRLRLTADGKVKPCLHSSAELSLKGLDRAGMEEVLRQAALAKPRCHEPLSASEMSGAGREMNRIGG